MSWLDGDHNPADLEPDTDPFSLVLEESDSLAELEARGLERNCCDGYGQVHHGTGALHFVTLCPNGCGARGWEIECRDVETAGDASSAVAPVTYSDFLTQTHMALAIAAANQRAIENAFQTSRDDSGRA